MSFPRYPKYKESGVEWLGAVPASWVLVPLKFVALLKGRLGWQGLRADEYTEDGPFLVTSEHFENDKVVWQRCHHVSEDRFAIAPDIQLRPDDLLMMKDGAAMGKLAYVDSLPGPACLNSHLLLFRPKDSRFINRFLYYVLSGPAFNIYMQRERKGSTFFGISQESIGAFPLLLPPVQEQAKIVAFLNHETAKIDALVAEQQRLIELLKEKRQAVISHAVTKGLNPDVPMKNSGVEWLGEVPTHWQVMPIRYAARLESGHTPSRNHPEYWEDCSVPWFTLADVWQIRQARRDVIFETKEKVSEMGLANSAARLLPKGTVMLSRTASVGFSAIMGVEMATTQDFANWVCGDRLRPEFLLHVLRSMQGEFSRLMMGSTHNTIYMPDIQALRFALPPVEEQERIHAFLRNETTRFDCLTDEARRAIDLLQERRTALISAAVTGQIDVRNITDRAAA